MTRAPDEIRKFLAAVETSGWDDVTLTEGETVIHVSRSVAPVAEPAPPPAPAAAAPAAHAPELIESPSVGIFWCSEAAAAAEPPLVQAGDVVAAGARLGSVAVLETLMPIRATAGGVVSLVHVTSGEPVEYGTPLFTIDQVAG